MCHQPPPHPKTQHPAPKLQPQVHHTIPHPSQAGACIPQACSPHPSLKPLHLHIPHIPPTPTQPHVRAPPGSMSVCLTWNAAHSQPRIQCTWVREGEGVEHQGLSHVCGIPQHSPQPTPQETHRMAAKALDGDCICPRAPPPTPNAQPHTHTAAPKQRRDNPVAQGLRSFRVLGFIVYNPTPHPQPPHLLGRPHPCLLCMPVGPAYTCACPHGCWTQ